MAIDFPASPTLNDVFTVGNVTYVWDGTKWTASVTGGISLDKIEEGNTSAEVIDTGSDGRFVVTTEGTGRLFVDASGQVSIGSSASGSPLNVSEQGVSGAPVIRFIGNAGNGNYMRGGWFASDNTTQLAQLSVDGTVAMYVGTISSTPVLLTTNNTERLRITSAGLVGIGTSSPQGRFESAAGDSTDYAIVANNSLSTGGEPNYISLNSGATRIGSINRSVNDIALKAYFGSVSFWTGTGGTATQKAVIDSSGRLGIGTTSVSFGKLCVSKGGAEGIEIEPGDSSNVNLIQHFNRSGAGWVSALNNAAAHIFTINGGGNEAARIDSSRRLLVGTSSGSGNNLLQVQGESGSSAGIGGIVLRRGLAPSLLVSGSIMGRIDFGPNDGGVGASIVGEGDAQQGTSDYPSRLVFSTTADGASSPTERMRIEQSGNIRFMNTGLVFPLTDNAVSLGLNGYRWTEVWAANGTIQTSDQRAKTDITSATLGSDFVKSLRPVSYRWVEGGKVDSGNRDEDGNYIYESVPGTRTHWGFIAQEVKQAVDATGVDFGGWLLTDKDDPDSQQALRYDQFIAPLTKALQEAIAKIETLEGMVAVNNITIDEQQHQLSTLAARLTALETP
jgi:hypothetical protein